MFNHCFGLESLILRKTICKAYQKFNTDPQAVGQMPLQIFSLSFSYKSYLKHITGLLYKIKTIFPDSIYKILKSYLENRYFLLKYREEHTPLHAVLSGVLQGSVLGPLLYLLHTADLPTTADSITATFADDNAILTTHEIQQ
jgi:hypothetical protein